jgi:hypothetical protein
MFIAKNIDRDLPNAMAVASTLAGRLAQIAGGWNHAGSSL